VPRWIGLLFDMGKLVALTLPGRPRSNAVIVVESRGKADWGL